MLRYSKFILFIFKSKFGTYCRIGFFLWSGFAFLSFVYAYAQDDSQYEGLPTSELLYQALIETNSNNPQLLSARLNVFVTAEDLQQAYGRVRPQVEVALNASQNWFSEDDKDDEDRYDNRDFVNLSAALVVDQAIYAGGALVYAASLAEIGLAASLEDLRQSEQEIFLQAIQVYMNYGRDLQILELRQHNVRRLRRDLQATQDRVLLGNATATDLSLAKSQLADAEADEIQAQADVDTAAANYEQVIGVPPMADFRVPTDQPSLPFVGDSEQSAQRALESNPVILAARLRLQQATININLEKSKYKPQINARGTLKHDEFGDEFLPNERQSFVLSGHVQIPIYQGGILDSQLRVAQFQKQRRQKDLLAQQRQVKADVLGAWAEFFAASAQWGARQTAIASAKLALQGIQEEFALGNRNLTEVLDAEQDLLETQEEALATQTDLHIAYYRLRAAKGQLTTTALRLEDPLAATAKSIASLQNYP